MYNQRLKVLNKQLRSLNLDSLLIFNPSNIAYLTGFPQAQGCLMAASKDELIYFTNCLYKEAAKKFMSCKLIVSDKEPDIYRLITNKIKKLRYKRIGFEMKDISFLKYKVLSSALNKEKIEFLANRDIIEESRAIKSKKEISLIKKSVQISQEAFSFIEEIFDEKMTEKELSIEIERFLRLKGDNELAFSPIVAAGKNSISPHHLPKDIKIGGENLLIDLGSRYYGYCADLTRVFFWGKMPFLFKKIYGIVKKAQELGIKKNKRWRSSFRSRQSCSRVY
ncbi:MAG: Xaa-Pro peptidase family protein [Candidatus Omnitrophota bacterium]